MLASLFTRSAPLSLTIVMEDQPVRVELTSRAARALEQRRRLVVEMELRYQCMVRTLVHVHEQVPEGQVVYWSEDRRVGIFYHAVIGQGACGVDSVGEREDRNAPREGKLPASLSLDFVKGRWLGAFRFS